MPTVWDDSELEIHLDVVTRSDVAEMDDACGEQEEGDLGDPGKVKALSLALHELLYKERDEPDDVDRSRRRWLKKFKAQDLLDPVLDIWKHRAAGQVPDPGRGGPRYDDEAQYLAVLRDVDPSTFKKFLAGWSRDFRNRRNLWAALEKRGIKILPR